jgi:acetylglutamate kinase
MDPALGAVGKVTRANPELLELLTSGGFLPVVACVAGDRQGNVYNVNADQMAVACAAGFGAERLIFLTDVEGVLDADKKIRPQLTAAECEQLIAAGVATGGMQAKLNAATTALAHGVGTVQIVPGALEGVVAKVLNGDPVGTRLVAAEAQNA